MVGLLTLAADSHYRVTRRRRRVNISEETYRHIKDDPQFQFESRGKVAAKNKRFIQIYFVDWKTAAVDDSNVIYQSKIAGEEER